MHPGGQPRGDGDAQPGQVGAVLVQVSEVKKYIFFKMHRNIVIKANQHKLICLYVVLAAPVGGDGGRCGQDGQGGPQEVQHHLSQASVKMPP